MLFDVQLTAGCSEDFRQGSNRRFNRRRGCQGGVSWGALIALAAISAVFFITFIPGVLIYPEAEIARPQSVSPIEGELESAYRQSNETLAQHIGDMRDVMEDGVCIADGKFESQLDSSSVDFGGAFAAAAERATPIDTAIPDGVEFIGTLNEWYLRNVVQIVPVEGARHMSAGVGTYIRPNVIATSSQLLSPITQSIKLVDHNLGEIEGQVISSGENNQGIALIEVANRSNGSYFRSSQVEKGRAVNAIGAADLATATTLQPLTVNTGIVTAKISNSEGISYLYHSALSGTGFAGAPLTDSCGRLVGIHAGGPDLFHPDALLGRAALASNLEQLLSAGGFESMEQDGTLCEFEMTNLSTLERDIPDPD